MLHVGVAEVREDALSLLRLPDDGEVREEGAQRRVQRLPREREVLQVLLPDQLREVVSATRDFSSMRALQSETPIFRQLLFLDGKQTLAWLLSCGVFGGGLQATGGLMYRGAFFVGFCIGVGKTRPHFLVEFLANGAFWQAFCGR